MNIGISSACLYPNETLKAIDILQKNNVEFIEIFINTFSELNEDYINKIEKIIKNGNIKVHALHPFSSGMETFFFATYYNARMEDGLNLYKRYFEICKKLNIKRFVFHGAHYEADYPFNRYCDNFARLYDSAKKYGVDICYENVVRCKSKYAENIMQLRQTLNNDIKFALDIKQMRRSKQKLNDMINAMGTCLDYLHLSDYTFTKDCVLPGTGKFNFESLFKTLIKNNFTGQAVIELYKDGYEKVGDIEQSAKNLQKIYEEALKIKGG